MTKSTLNANDHDLLIRVDARTQDMAQNVDKMTKNFENISSIFASKEELEEVVKQVEIRLQVNAEDIRQLKGPKKYLNMAVNSLVSGVALYLILFYLGHIK